MLRKPEIAPRELRDLPLVQDMRDALKRLDETPGVETAADILANCRHEWTRNAVCAALMTYGGPDARAALRKAVGQRDWARGCLLELLAWEGPTGELVAEFMKPDAKDRAKIAELLAVRGDRAALPALRAAAATEQTAADLAAELEAIVRLGGAEPAGEALAHVEKCDARGKVRVGGALAAAGAGEGFVLLSRALGDKDRYTRHLAARALAESGRAAATPGLIAAIADSSRWVRQEGTAGLGRAGTAEALPPLRLMAKSDPEPYLRAEARWAIRQIEGRR
jgi:hypothetical protein